MFSILRQSAAYWVAMASFRKQRERCKRYTYGDQWHDRICVDGQWMREEDYIRQQGNEPLKNNLIRRLVRNVIGLYRQQHTASLSPSLGGGQGEVSPSPSLGGGQGEVIGGQGEALEVSARTLEEFLISGLAVLRQSWGTRRGITGCWTDIVAPDSFFVDTFARDPSGWDISCIGELHDMPFSVLCRHFASSPDDVQRLQRVYNVVDYDDRLADVCELFGQQSPAIDFFHARGNLCRVMEVWRLEQQQRYRCHDTATGELYQVSADDYVFKAYPFIDGEIHSFVADLIDQQRYTNRLITLYDWIMRSSAKGVLLVPEESIPDGYSLADIADEWARFNGVIAIRTKNGAQMPQQVAMNATNVGIKDLLQTQLDFFEDISGVAGVLQGKRDGNSNNASLFAYQTNNATLSLLDIIETFQSFIDEVALKKQRLQQQFGGKG